MIASSLACPGLVIAWSPLEERMNSGDITLLAKVAEQFIDNNDSDTAERLIEMIYKLSDELWH